MRAAPPSSTTLQACQQPHPTCNVVCSHRRYCHPGCFRITSTHPIERGGDLREISPRIVSRQAIALTLLSPTASSSPVSSRSSSNSTSSTHPFCSPTNAFLSPSLSTSRPHTMPVASLVNVFAKRVVNKSMGPCPSRDLFSTCGRCVGGTLRMAVSCVRRKVRSGSGCVGFGGDSDMMVVVSE